MFLLEGGKVMDYLVGVESQAVELMVLESQC